MSDRFDRRNVRELFRHRHSLVIKFRLLFSSRGVVTDVTHFRRRRHSGLVPVPIRQVELVVLVSDLTRPVRELKGFQRIQLEQGETRRVTFTLTEEQLAFTRADGSYGVEPGNFHVWIAPDSTRGLRGEFRL